MNKGLTATLAIIIVILVSAVGYFIFQNQKVLKKLENQKQEQKAQPSTSSAQLSPKPSPSKSPSSQFSQKQVKENIQAAINSKNFAAISTYTTSPKVNVSLMSSECCQPQTPDEAAKQIEYIQDGVPLDFNQENLTIKNLKAKNPQLVDAFIGISQNKEQLAAFKFDDQNKISWIQLAITWKLYSY